MIAAVEFFPWLLVILDQILWVVLCALTLRINIVKMPSILLLFSSSLGLLISIEVLLLKIQKASGVQILPTGDAWILLTTINRYVDFVSRIALLAAAFWIVILFIRHKKAP